MTDLLPVLVSLRLGTVAAGFLVSLWTLRMILRTREHRLTYGLLFLGFALLTLGVVLEGLLFELAGWDLAAAHSAEAMVSAGGFLAILVAIVGSRV